MGVKEWPAAPVVMVSGHDQAQRDRAADLLDRMRMAAGLLEAAMSPGLDVQTVGQLVARARSIVTEAKTTFGGLIDDWRRRPGRHGAAADAVLSAIDAIDQAFAEVGGHQGQAETINDEQ
jgi:hypothetical protein